MTPEEAIAALAGSTAPWLFGVRHHSPACAAALPPLLDAFQPTAIALELPADLGHWIEWLSHPDASAPLAVAAVAESGQDLGFYPFADFSPELVVVRWARERGVPVHAIDLPVASRAMDRDRGHSVGIEKRLRGAADDSWDALVEGPGTMAEPERVRRAALLYGWALRMDEQKVGRFDRTREAHMRAEIAKIEGRVAAVIGAFHAPALLAEPMLWSDPGPAPMGKPLVSSLIPYAFELLDARSGYPAGIRDPAWQQRSFDVQWARGDHGALVAACLVEITRGIRARGLPASVADARAAADMAMSLATLRGLAVPGRRELVEAVQTALAHGEVMGRGRAVAKAMEAVLVGTRRGHLADGTPRSGLGPHVQALLEALRLPAKQAADAVDLRLDPLRSKLDRRRHVALARLRACGVPYGDELESVAAGGLEALTSSWRVRMTPATEALIELAGLRGVTLRQAASGSLRAERARLETPADLVLLASAAAEAGAGDLVAEVLHELAGPKLHDATLPALIATLALIDRIAAGHIVALPASADDAVAGEIDAFAAPALDRSAIVGAAVASVLGLAGSDSLDDARSLGELVRVLERPEHAAMGDGRLRWSIGELVRTGTPVIAGAASVIEVLVAVRTAEELATTMGGWVDAGVDADGRTRLADRLRGALVVAGPLFEATPVFLAGVSERVERMSDDDFLGRAPALRHGFELLSAASRRRLLESLGTFDERELATEISPELMVLAAEADAVGRAAIEGIEREVAEDRAGAGAGTGAGTTRATEAHSISVRDRWRMILGQQRDRMQPRALRAATALDELYGQGHGEGSRAGQGGGRERAYPTVRDWKDDIEALFGERVYQEVAGKAAAAGRVGALLELDPGAVTPSVELLEQVLSLKGALGEGNLGRLRALVKRVVEELTRELAVRVRPALTGPPSQRATRRPTRTLHLRRTVSANLHTARDGMIVPERLYFKERSRRHLDWHVVLVVDVSGSMEPSVIYSAMMSAILSGVPWISVKFVAFSTEIVDLSDHASDPLALLLEVAVGGGTHIGKALRYARSLLTVPRRSIVLVVSDFEEGVSIEQMLGEVRGLVEAGATCLGLAALDDRGAPRYALPIAEQVAAAGMPIAALTPLELARWIGDKIR